MEFDWGTFLLETLNFLVLLWLLQRFLYRPVLAGVEQRRAEMAQARATAEALIADAEAARVKYEHAQQQQDEARARGQAALVEELAAERARRQASLEAEMKDERERRTLLFARESESQMRESERRALSLAARFGARLLERVADAELENRIIDLALADLDRLEPAVRDTLRSMPPTEGARVKTAYAINAIQRARIASRLDELLGRAAAPTFERDDALMAGLRVEIGHWVMTANLRDELQFFAATCDAFD